MEVPEQLSQMLQAEGVYGQPCVQEQRLSKGGRRESTKSCNCCGKPFWLHSRKGAACVSTSTVPPAKRTRANSVQRKAACLLPVICVKQIPSLLCLDFSRLSLRSAEREPLATSLCCFSVLVIAKPSPYLVCWSMCSGRGLGAGPCPAVGCREAWGGQGQRISPGQGLGSVEEPHLSKESLCSQQTPRRVAALLPGTAAVRPVGSGGLGCRGGTPGPVLLRAEAFAGHRVPLPTSCRSAAAAIAGGELHGPGPGPPCSREVSTARKITVKRARRG